MCKTDPSKHCASNKYRADIEIVQIAWSAFKEKKTRKLTQNEYRVKKQDLFLEIVANLQENPFFKISRDMIERCMKR